jgi:hypothetical protein
MSSKLEVRHVELWSLFKLSFFIYACIGLIMGLFYEFIMLVLGGINSALVANDMPNFGFLGGVLGLFMIPFLAFMYGILGSVIVTIGGWIYNIIAGLAGGIQFEAVEVTAAEGTIAPSPHGGVHDPGEGGEPA